MSERTADQSSGRIVITGGGQPTPEALAAVIVALTPPASAQAGPGDAHGSAWREASLLEGVGFRAFVSVDDVERYHRSLA